MKRWVLVGLLLMGWSTTGWADPGTKLARGLSNVAFGWFEILNEIGHEADRHGPEIGIVSGAVRGTVFGIGRTLVGVYETVTFVFPNGRKGYEPILLPESALKRR